MFHPLLSVFIVGFTLGIQTGLDRADILVFMIPATVPSLSMSISQFLRNAILKTTSKILFNTKPIQGITLTMSLQRSGDSLYIFCITSVLCWWLRDMQASHERHNAQAKRFSRLEDEEQLSHDRRWIYLELFHILRPWTIILQQFILSSPLLGQEFPLVPLQIKEPLDFFQVQ